VCDDGRVRSRPCATQRIDAARLKKTPRDDVGWREERIAQEIERVDEPLVEGHLERPLRPIHDRRWKQWTQCLAQHPLLDAAAPHQVTTESSSEFDDVAAKERHADLEAMRHSGSISPLECEVMEVRPLVVVERPLERAFAR
jgi:hypothetical protein